MQVSYFETGRYYAPSNLPREWPMPAGAYDREAGLRAFRGMVERSRYVEELGFDWVSVSEHHYSPRILTPSLPIAAAYIASHVHDIKIALLGPIVPQSNPVLLAEEMAMLDTMAEGRLIVGMLRGTTNEMLTYDLNPEESRERTDEGMELILRAWREPQPFGWQGRHFRYRTVSVWPKPGGQHENPGLVRVASKLYARFQQISNTVVRWLRHSLPVLFLVLLAEGQTVQVPGTDLTVTVRSVRDLTSEGCLGGPIGCLDTVRLEITRGNLSQQITLSAARNEIQRDQGVSRTTVFGHEITLAALKHQRVVLDIAN
jgi:luciferase-like monooxygenase